MTKDRPGRVAGERGALTRPTMDGVKLGRLGSTAAIVAAVLMLSGSFWLVFTNLTSVQRSDTFVEQANGKQLLLDALLSTLTDAETGQRGYLITGDAQYLAPYDAAKSRLSAELRKLDALRQSAEQSQRVGRIHNLAASKMAELDQTVTLARTGERQAALDLVRTNAGKQSMDALRAEIDRLRPGDDDALQRDRALARSAWPRLAGVVLGVLSFALMGLVGLEQRRGRRAASDSLSALKRFTRAFGHSQGLLRTLDGTITFWARGMERLYGFSAQEAIGRRSDELLETQFSTPRAEIQATLEREGHWEGDVIKHRRDGSTVDVATQWTLYSGDEGGAEHVIVLDTDISARRHAERADTKSSMLLRTIVETAPGPIYAKDRYGNMLLANAGTLKLIGRPWAEVEGRTVVEFLPNRAQAEIVMTNDRRVMETGRVEYLEEEIVGDDGDTRVWLSTKTPFRNPDGLIDGLVGVSVEITELKLRANEQVELNEDLTLALEARDIALQQRDILLREVYHRVKNNLQIIDGFIVLQARQMIDPDAKIGLLGLRNRLHALALVHHQLMHSANLRTFDIAPFLKELVSTIVQGGAGDGVALSVSAIPLEVGLDFAIPIGLLAAELVTNSIKHAFPDGEGTITVSLESAANGEIALIVSDNGQGRSASIAAEGLKKPGLGTGIINGLVNQLDGEQIMQNENGTRTEIRVPSPALS